MKRSNYILVLALIFTAFLTKSCSVFENNEPFYGEFILDNPTDTPITATVDDKKYELAAYQHEKLNLKAGRHSMTTTQGETVDFIVTVENNGGVLNPTRSIYYRYRMTYVREGRESATGQHSTLLIDGIEYEAPARMVSGTIIDEKTEDWQFPIHKPFDDVAYVEKDNVVATTRFKLFTKKELIDFLEAGTEYEGYHEANKTASHSHLTYQEPKEAITYFVPDFKTAELKRLATEMVELDKEFGKAETESRQKELLKEYKELWKTYVEEGMKEKYDAAEYEKRAQLKFHNFTKGAIIL